MNFAEKLIRLRKAGGMSQEDLADVLGVSRQAVSRWEQGHTYPDVPNLQKLMNVFDVSADYLIRDGHPEGGDPGTAVPSAPEQPKAVFDIRRNRFLIIGFIWLFSAFCFLIAAIDTLNILHLVLTGVDILLASVNFLLHFRLVGKNAS